MLQKFKYQFILHFIVFIWGFTAILGKFITKSSDEIVLYRMGIAFASLFLIAPIFKKKLFPTRPKDVFVLIGIGVIVGAHWLTFFEAIKVSTVSVAIIAMSSGTLFMSLLEPLFFKRKIRLYEILISIAIMGGIFFINSVEKEGLNNGNVALGIGLALISSFLATLFTVLNGLLVKKIDSYQITLWEMMGGVIFTSLIIFGFKDFDSIDFSLDSNNLIALLVLAIVCTSFAFLVSTWVMKFVTPFTVSISINMEPIYAMILAVILYPESETMTIEFYIGALIIIVAVFLNAFFKSKFSTK